MIIGLRDDEGVGIEGLAPIDGQIPSNRLVPIKRLIRHFQGCKHPFRFAERTGSRRATPRYRQVAVRGKSSELKAANDAFRRIVVGEKVCKRAGGCCYLSRICRGLGRAPSPQEGVLGC